MSWATPWKIVFIHFAGLLIGEHAIDKGIVSKMINGGE